MRIFAAMATALLTLATTAGATQSATSPKVAHDYGFTYHLPSDWTTVEPVVPPSTSPHTDDQKPSPIDDRKGSACVEVPLTARHGDKSTTVVIDALPFECYGQKMTQTDLETFGAGAAEGLKQAFDVSDSVTANYTLARHAMWMERARAVAKGSAKAPYTLEIVCTLLEKAAVCWVAWTADETDLKLFEQTPVALDGSAAARLVPADVFTSSR